MPDHHDKAPAGARRGLFGRLLRRRDGTAAIEFAILAVPFFVLIFASLETFLAFTAEQSLANATDTMARRIRTGQITFDQGKSTDMTETQFRAAFCAEISVIMPCSSSEIASPDKLLIDVRSFTNFATLPAAVPRSEDGVLNTAGFGFAPGGKKSINVVRVYYRWPVVTDLVRPQVAGLRPADGSKQSYLMVATAVIQNEDYP